MAEERKVTFGLKEKTAYVLIYLFGWISGLIFYLSEKEDKQIRFHALQVIIFSAGFSVIMIILEIIIGIITAATIMSAGLGGLAVLTVFGIIIWLLWIVYVVMIIIAIVKACSGGIFKLPVAYKIAEKHVK